MFNSKFVKAIILLWNRSKVYNIIDDTIEVSCLIVAEFMETLGLNNLGRPDGLATVYFTSG